MAEQEGVGHLNLNFRFASGPVSAMQMEFPPAQV
jgi:hypothetical protein